MKNGLLALRIFLQLALPYFRSEDRWRACGLLAGVIGSELYVVYVAVKINEWNGTFFNALEARNWSQVQGALIVYCTLAISAILSAVGQYWFGQTLLIRWREWMTQRYVAMWMTHGRHYRIRFVDDSVDNIHLRIGNDVLLFLQRTHELGTGFLQSIIVLVSFTYILWGVSLIAPMPLFGTDLSFPGYLIVIAIGYAVLGTMVIHFVGWRLIPLQFRQQRFESDFRFALARVTDHSNSVALMGGEAVERSELQRRLDALVRNWLALVSRQNFLNFFVYGYYHGATLLPVFVVTPAYLVGAISLGVLMQAALAFNKVEGAFAFCITSYSKIAEWRAVMNRVAQFETAMGKVDQPGLANASLDFGTSPNSDLTISDLVLRLPTGEPVAAVPALDVRPGERLLVNGPSGAGKSCLFRGLAGIWPLGEGQVACPGWCARSGVAATAVFSARHFAASARLSDAHGGLGRRANTRGDGGGRPRASCGTARRGSRVEHGAFRRRATAGGLRAGARLPADDPAVGRGSLRPGRGGSTRPLPHAGTKAALDHRHLDRPSGGTRRPASAHDRTGRFARHSLRATPGAARGGAGMIGVWGGAKAGGARC